MRRKKKYISAIPPHSA